MGKILSGIKYTLLFILIFVIVVLGTLMGTILMIIHGPSESARDLFVTTFLETGQMKFVVKWFVQDNVVQEILNKNSMEEFDIEMDDSLITINDDKKSNEISIETITGNTFLAKMIIVKDPSRVKIASTSKNGKWGEYGKTLETIVKDYNAFAGVNGGLYYSVGNKGGKPMGLVVENGKITYNDPDHIKGLYIIGFNENDLLKIIDITGKSAKEVEEIVKKEKIRDAITFQDETNGSNAHFVKLIINGETRDLKGTGSGVHPRTAIGQREDGTILILVTDGRGASGHLGATASDLISIMKDYGAINAANIDGGSSSSMYYDGQYEMTSVTLGLRNTSWRLPTAFIVERR